jgi:hypothetical protein
MLSTMHCPGCGTEGDLDQKYCRKCGFDLAPVSKLILKGGGEVDDSKLDKTERDKLIMRRMVSWMMWGMLTLLIGIVTTIIGKQLIGMMVTILGNHLPLERLVGLLGSFLILGGVSVTTYGVLDALRGGLKKRRAADIAPPANNEILPASTTKELEGRLPTPMTSVTERTTQLIGVNLEERS